MRSVFRVFWTLVTTFFVPLSATAQPARTETTFSEVLKQWSELSLQGQSRLVQGLRLSSGHVTLVLTQGSAAPVRAGDEVVGVFFQGRGSLEYVSADPVEFPIVSYNVRKNTSLTLVPSGSTLTIRDTFEEVLWLAGGAAPPFLPESSSGTALGDAFAKHLKKFGQVEASPVAHEFTAWRLNGPDQPLVRAEISGGSEDLIYHLDGLDETSESLFALRSALRKAKEIDDRLYLTVLSDQPAGRDRREPLVPRFLLTDVGLSVTASDGKDVSMSVTENFVAVGGRISVLRLDLYDTTFGRDTFDPRHLRVKGVFDEASNPVPFDHAKDELVVGLATPLAPGASTKLRFEIEGDILYQPHGYNYWELGVEPWFPQPDLSGQYYTVHSTVRVKKPLVPFAPGKTLRRTVEADYNLLETRIDKPVQFMVILAGNFAYREETKNGVIVRVATYAGESPNLRRVLGLAHEMIAFYEPFLGPFPFDEFNIVEISAWEFGQNPPGFMFITSNYFRPLSGEAFRVFSKGINERIAHEIAHQYWGHVVKMPSDEEQWLTESFAEISAGLLIRQWRGNNEFEGLTNYWRSRAKEATQRAPIPLANRIYNKSDTRTAEHYRTDLLYCKGPSILNSVRVEIGDDAFAQFLRSIQARCQWKFGSTKMVQAILEAITQKDWKPFFDANYWGTSLPKKLPRLRSR